MLSIYQGNDKTFYFYRKDFNGNIINTAPHEIWFSVKERYKDASVVFQKTTGSGIEQNPDGSWNVRVEAIDTANLKPGKYVCDVKIEDEEGRLFTIVRPQEFLIREVVTKVSNQGG